MPRKKLIRINQVLEFENVFCEESKIKGSWGEKVFKNQNPIVLELACGRGYYTLALGQEYPGKNFIGIDRKGDRIWYGAKEAIEKNLKNVAFLKTDIKYLADFFEKDEVSEIWITFPDPFPKPSKANKRLTAPGFLEIYKSFLRKDGRIHLKTDNQILFDYSLDVMTDNGDIEELIFNVHEQDRVEDVLKIMTFYEKKFMEKGEKIKYLRFSLKS